MTLHQLVDQSYQIVMQQLQNTRIILLHPHSRYRSVIIAKLVNEPKLETFYYAMGPDDINLRSFITGITQCLTSQFPMFGRYINLLPQNVYARPEKHFDLVLETFLKDLAELTSNDFLLILDEYDRSDKSDDVQRFVEQLSSNIPANCRIILNSRTLPRLPWIAMIAQKRAIMLLDDQIVQNDFYGRGSNGDEPEMEVFGLGAGFVLMNGNMVDNWEGHLPRLLFFFALDRPVVTRSEICQAFWPDLPSDQAVNVFHVTKRRLHKALGMDMLVHSNGYYRINPELNIYYDVMDFVSTLMYARGETNVDKRMNAWERIGDLYRGEFLTGHHDDWIVKRRAEFLDGYIESLVSLADLWNESGRYEQALTLYLKAVNADFNREDLHRGVLQHYHLLGRRSELAAHYKKLTTHMKQQKRKISEEIQALYKEFTS